METRSVRLQDLIDVMNDLVSRWPDTRVSRNEVGNLVFAPTAKPHELSLAVGYIDLMGPSWAYFDA